MVVVVVVVYFGDGHAIWMKDCLDWCRSLRFNLSTYPTKQNINKHTVRQKQDRRRVEPNTSPTHSVRQLGGPSVHHRLYLYREEVIQVVPSGVPSQRHTPDPHSLPRQDALSRQCPPVICYLFI